jgi:hypothetical protein
MALKLSHGGMVALTRIVHQWNETHSPVTTRSHCEKCIGAWPDRSG